MAFLSHQSHALNCLVTRADIAYTCKFHVYYKLPVFVCCVRTVGEDELVVEVARTLDNCQVHRF